MTVSDDEIAGLMQSIKEVGLLQPIGVVKTGTGFEICYGNRRFLATSKLGFKKIPVIVHVNKSDVENDLKNLTENIQRRNISLTEAGRYMQMLRESKLSNSEIAVRLGINKNYVSSCLIAYQGVPKEFRNDLEVRTGMQSGEASTPGKITITAARAILSTSKDYNLNVSQQKKLFEAAKSDDRFNHKNVPKYAQALKRGKDPLDTVKPMHRMAVRFWIDEKHKNDLEAKFVTDGPFKSLNGLMVSILKGEKAVKVNVLK